ncbi:MAG: protoheme IX farnesyltransferase [Flavobacteriales bacterium]|nr:protoheme IX farnesyltransferase [Flavobacteriales bacterium]MBT5090172.1 protoheme IX farnesyltransferase [Flavobacteriales bacterium]
MSITVVFSAIIGYLLGVDTFDITTFSLLVVGGFFVTGAANGLNQVIEREHDKFMERTAVRPLPLGNLSVTQAFIFSILLGALGIFALNYINPQGSFFGLMSKSGAFGLLSMVLYVLAYTPLKRISSFAITVGAVPGAIPFLLGFVAATDDFGIAAGTLFAIQFFWQYPHFIAIAWVQDAEYKKAGFKMMFGGEKGKFSAFIGVVTAMLMTFISIAPFLWEIPLLSLSIYGLVTVFLLGFWFTFKAVKLYKNCDDVTARALMLSSFTYLPLMQIVYVLDKFIIQ